MRLEACLSDSWWEFAFATATHVYNCTPIKHLKWKIPQEIFTGEKPKISHLYVFGYEVYVYLPNDLFATHKGMLYSALPKLSLMKDTSLDIHCLTPESKHLLVD